MLQASDFEVASSNAPEFRHVNRLWPVYSGYERGVTESEVYFYARDFGVSKVDYGSGRTDEPLASPVVYEFSFAFGVEGREDIEGREELEERLVRYFSSSFRSSVRQELQKFFSRLLEIASTSDVDESASLLRSWIDREHATLDLDAREYWVDSFVNLSVDLVEFEEQCVSDVLKEALTEHIEGGTDRLMAYLEELCKGLDSRDSFALRERIRKDLESGLGAEEALRHIASVDSDERVLVSTFMKKWLFNARRDSLKLAEEGLHDLANHLVSRRRSFTPLSIPGLFLEFAEMGGDDISEDDVFDWIIRHGVLGLSTKHLSGDSGYLLQRGGAEIVSRFAHEARQANWVKRVYENATLLESTDQEEVNKASENLRALFEWSVHHSNSVAEIKEKALGAVRRQIQDYLNDHCSLEWRTSGNGLTEFLEFETLLGAMYLQFSWVLREASDVRPCKFCGKPIDTETINDSSRGNKKTYRNKRFCRRKCKHDFENKVKREKREGEASILSVTPYTRSKLERMASSRGLDVSGLLAEMILAYEDRQ